MSWLMEERSHENKQEKEEEENARIIHKLEDPNNSFDYHPEGNKKLHNHSLFFNQTKSPCLSLEKVQRKIFTEDIKR